MPEPRVLIHQDTQLELHPSWPDLTERQREAINEVWDDMVIPALERAAMAETARIEAVGREQDARDGARLREQEAERRAQRERERRQELLIRIAQLEALVFELKGGPR